MRILTILLVVFFIACSSYAVEDFSTESHDLVNMDEVSTETFATGAEFTGGRSKLIEGSSALTNAMKGKPSVVVFFNARCGRCKNFESEWTQITKTVNGVQFLAYDARKHPVIPPGFQFRYYPSIWYVNAAGRQVPYNGSLISDGVVKFINREMKYNGKKSSLLENIPQPLQPLSAEDMNDHCVHKSLVELSTVQTEQADAEMNEEADLDAEDMEDMEEEDFLDM